MAKLYRLYSPWQNMREPIYLWDLNSKKREPWPRLRISRCEAWTSVL